MKHKEIKTYHCLFLKYNNMVRAVLYEKGKMMVLTERGETCVSYDGMHWRKWIRQVSFESSQRTDFCLISDDNDWMLPEELSRNQCAAGESIWNLSHIEEAVRAISLPFTVDLKLPMGENYTCCKAPWSHNKAVELTIDFPALYEANNEPDVLANTNHDALTPLAEHFIDCHLEDEKRRLK